MIEAVKRVEIGAALRTPGGTLVADEVVPGNHRIVQVTNAVMRSLIPRLVEVHAIDRRQEIDTAWRHSDLHDHLRLSAARNSIGHTRGPFASGSHALPGPEACGVVIPTLSVD